MSQYRSGNKAALDQLFQILYPELRRLAASRMRGERATHTLQPTELVNELYMELAKIHGLPPGRDAREEKAEFLRFAAYVMRRQLIRHARPLSKRVDQVTLFDVPLSMHDDRDEMLELESLLNRLEQVNLRLRQVVEMKVFEEMSREEIALRLGCTIRTVARDWHFAQEWLCENLHPGTAGYLSATT
jgi:RNA polymerase sigma factor (TIGR02999 family)